MKIRGIISNGLDLTNVIQDDPDLDFSDATKGQWYLLMFSSESYNFCLKYFFVFITYSFREILMHYLKWDILYIY